MISISTLTSDTMGSVVINELPSSDLDTKTARVNRSKTLDGGVYINHFGFSHGDRTLKIDSNLPESQVARINHIFTNYTSVLVSMRDGVYKGTIKDVNAQGQISKITILIEQKEK